MEENSQSWGGDTYTLDPAAMDSTLELWAVSFVLWLRTSDRII